MVFFLFFFWKIQWIGECIYGVWSLPSRIFGGGVHKRGSFLCSFKTNWSGEEYLRDFRLISLVGSPFKILAKEKANRLKKVIGKSGVFRS